jgi:hypothetical protein
MLQAGKMMEIMNEFDKFNVGTAALQEIRWNGQGRTDKNFTLIHSDPQVEEVNNLVLAS